MEETAVASMECVLIALIALAVLLGIVWYVLSRRMQAMELRLQKLEEENASLRSMIQQPSGNADEEGPDKAATNMPSQPVHEAAVVEEQPAPAPLKNPVVPVGTRHPVVVPAHPMVAVSSKKQKPSGGLSPEVVAVIMAAVAACGYSPAAIRSIRPVQRRSANWVMAGRLANMK